MRYQTLGSSDLKVSKICLGCMGFGDASTGQHSWTIDEEHSREILRQALEGGINFFDTAIAYQNGSSERFVGRALKDFASRDEVVLATKFLPRPDGAIAAGLDGRAYVKKMCEKSLEHLGFDYIDLYIYHMWDYRTPLVEIMQGLHELVQEGRVRYLGISNCFPEQLQEANALAAAEGLTPFVSMQGHYNLIFREEEKAMLPYCREHNITYTPYSPLASGRLCRMGDAVSKRLSEDSYAHLKYDQAAGKDAPVIARLHELSQKRGEGMTALALAWLIHQGTVPVCGVTKLQQLQGLLQAAEIDLTPEECQWLEELYQPHELVGVMAQNTKEAASKPQVWHQANADLK